MVIFLAGFVPGQGALPALRRVFHAPLTGRKTGDTGPNSEMSAQGALAAPGEGLSASGGKFRHGAANCGTGFSSEPERARLKDVRTRPSNALSARHYFGALCRKVWCTVFF